MTENSQGETTQNEKSTGHKDTSETGTFLMENQQESTGASSIVAAEPKAAQAEPERENSPTLVSIGSEKSSSDNCGKNLEKEARAQREVPDNKNQGGSTQNETTTGHKGTSENGTCAMKNQEEATAVSGIVETTDLQASETNNDPSSLLPVAEEIDSDEFDLLCLDHDTEPTSLALEPPPTTENASHGKAYEEEPEKMWPSQEQEMRKSKQVPESDSELRKPGEKAPSLPKLSELKDDIASENERDSDDETQATVQSKPVVPQNDRDSNHEREVIAEGKLAPQEFLEGNTVGDSEGGDEKMLSVYELEEVPDNSCHGKKPGYSSNPPNENDFSLGATESAPTGRMNSLNVEDDKNKKPQMPDSRFEIISDSNNEGMPHTAKTQSLVQQFSNSLDRELNAEERRVQQKFLESSTDNDNEDGRVEEPTDSFKVAESKEDMSNDQTTTFPFADFFSDVDCGVDMKSRSKEKAPSDQTMASRNEEGDGDKKSPTQEMVLHTDSDHARTPFAKGKPFLNMNSESKTDSDSDTYGQVPQDFLEFKANSRNDENDDRKSLSANDSSESNAPKSPSAEDFLVDVDNDDTGKEPWTKDRARSLQVNHSDEKGDCEKKPPALVIDLCSSDEEDDDNNTSFGHQHHASTTAARSHSSDIASTTNNSFQLAGQARSTPLADREDGEPGATESSESPSPVFGNSHGDATYPTRHQIQTDLKRHRMTAMKSVQPLHDQPSEGPSLRPSRVKNTAMKSAGSAPSQTCHERPSEWPSERPRRAKRPRSGAAENNMPCSSEDGSPSQPNRRGQKGTESLRSSPTHSAISDSKEDESEKETKGVINYIKYRDLPVGERVYCVFPDDNVSQNRTRYSPLTAIGHANVALFLVPLE
jgi:hypothetical protein